MDFIVEKSRLKGEITIPPSKSETLRAILFATLAKGTSEITNYLDSPDTYAMIEACRTLGATIEMTKTSLKIEGATISGSGTIDAGNSGIVLRFIGGVASLGKEPFIITGDHSVQTRRIVKPLLDGLTQLGASAISLNHGFAPIQVQGPLLGGEAFISGRDSQPVSALLIAAAFSKKKTVLHVENPGETPWISLTLSWFDRLGISYKAKDFCHYEIEGKSEISGFKYSVPGDLSSASFPLIAALITRSALRINNVDVTQSQGDKALFFLLQTMGAKLTFEKNALLVEESELEGGSFDINECIDALPILSVLGCFTKREIEIKNGSIARHKESDRIHAITTELRKMGANIVEEDEGLVVFPSQLRGAKLFSHHDHRIAMSLAVSGLMSNGKTQISDCECVFKTYPSFATSFQKIGAQIESHFMRPT